MKRITLIIAAVTLPLLGCGAGGSSAVDSASVSRAGGSSVVGSASVSGVGVAAHSAARPAGGGAAAALHCRSVNGLPDRHCTPGATYARVTQATIGRTICVRGWTATVRPPESYTENLKREQIAEYGYRDKRLHDYEEDHLIPLELGGSPRSVKNLWPEFDGGAIPNPKDKVEDALRAAVCAHRVRLAPAQRAIARDWKTAERVLGLTAPQPAPSPTSPTPKPSPTRTASALSCSAAVSNSQPADYTTVHVYVTTAAGAGVTTVAHYKTTSHRKSATADSRGKATIAYYISGATRGYRVVVDVTVTRGSATARCSTSFTPA